jgi:hypothetical protein
MQHRHCFALPFRAAILLALVTQPCLPVWGEALGDQNQRVQIKWSVPEPQLSAVENKLAFVGERHREQERGPAVFMVLVGLASLPSLADAIVSVYDKVKGCGVVIDACGQKLEINQTCTISGAVKVVFCPDKV